jgi:transcriptional regulator with XRE-family HTH domain
MDLRIAESWARLVLNPRGARPIIIIMNDNSGPTVNALGARIRELRRSRGLTLAALAERVGTSAPTLHRYEGGWDRFELATLRRIAEALDARLEVRILTARHPSGTGARSSRALVRLLKPLFWDKTLSESDLVRHRAWVLTRVLTAGDKDQVRAARAAFGDDAIRKAVERRGVDPRTRNYWRLILGVVDRAS